MTHPGYPPEDPQQQYPQQAPAYPGYPPPPQPTGSWPATSTPPYAVSGAPPATGVPYGQAPPQQGGRAPMLVAVVAAVALFLLAGVMTGLYVAKSSQLGDTRDSLTTQVSEKDQTIKGNNEKITQLESDLKTSNEELSKSKDSLADVTKERDALLPCMRRFIEALDAAGSNNDAALDTALRQATTACEKARDEVDDS